MTKGCSQDLNLAIGSASSCLFLLFRGHLPAEGFLRNEAGHFTAGEGGWPDGPCSIMTACGSSYQPG